MLCHWSDEKSDKRSSQRIGVKQSGQTQIRDCHAMS